MNFWKRYPADYAKKTARLTLVQHGAYSLLLDEIYLTESALPGDIEELYRVCRAMTRYEREAVAFVADKFFPVGEDGNRHNARAAEEIEAAAPAVKAARENGKKGGRPKTHRETQPVSRSETQSVRNIETTRARIAQSSDLREETIDPSGLVAGTSYRPPPSPNLEIVNLYRKHLPQLPGVEVLNDSRKRAIAARWREVCTSDKLTRAAALEWFDWYFAHVAKSKFLTGQIPGKSGRIWQADFDFLMNASKFPRVVEGSYHKDAA